MRSDITLRLKTAQIHNTQQLRWCLLLRVEGTSFNHEVYGETPGEAFEGMADLLDGDAISTLRWACEHQEHA